MSLLGGGYLTYTAEPGSGDYWSELNLRQAAQQNQRQKYLTRSAELLRLGYITFPDFQSDGQQVLTLIKKSVQKIKAEPFDAKVRKNIETKIGRLQKAGATAQAAILEAELKVRDALVRLTEWDYPLLTKDAIGKYEDANKMTATRDGIRIHIDTLESYTGNPAVGEAKDRIIPDAVLEKLEVAKERELFDEFKVLWVERVPDPILLGCVAGCLDYFCVCEWGDDISFEQIQKGEK